jgi:cell cycle checkpoint control protein RAD9A
MLPHQRISSTPSLIFLTLNTKASHKTKATLLLAEQLSLNLIIRFLDPVSPIYLEIEGDLAETLFVISTSQVFDPHNGDAAPPLRPKTRVVDPPRAQQRPNRRKRPLEHEQQGDDDDDDALYRVREGRSDPHSRPDSRASSITEYGARKRPMNTKAATRTDRASLARELGAANPSASMPPPSFVPGGSSSALPPPPASPHGSVFAAERHDEASSSHLRSHEPLFLPASQLSQVAVAAIRESGLGIEDMDADEFAAMMESEGVEVERRDAGLDPDSSQGPGQVQEAGRGQVDQLAGDDDDEDDAMDLGGQAQRSDSFDLYYDGTQLEPTQGSSGSKVNGIFCL